MKYSDIKIGNVYYADLTPVRKFEFGGTHLGIVINKGKDKKTVTIVSLTSKSSGVGENKLDAGVISGLPKRLVEDKQGNPVRSYVVLDQVRTVAAGRIEDIKNGRRSDGKDIIVNCPVNPSLLKEIVQALADLTLSNLNVDVIGEYHKKSFFNHCVKNIIDLTYQVNQGNKDKNEKEIRYLYSNALSIENDFAIEAYLGENDIKNNIAEKVRSITFAEEARISS